MKNLRSIVLLAVIVGITAPQFTQAAEGDTTVVQTFTFGSVQNDWFLFPPDTGTYQRIFMMRTLKCVPGNNPSCGEWDYLTYTYLYDHTGVLDSNLLSHANFLVNNTTPDTFPYSASPGYSYTPFWDYFTNRTATTSFDSAIIAAASGTANHPLTSNETDARTQYLWHESELTAAGLVAGNITGIRLDVTTAGSTMRHLQIKMKETTDTVAGALFDDAGFLTVFDRTITIGSAGWYTIPFTTNFPWSGFGNIRVEISIDGQSTGINNTVNINNTAFQSAVMAADSDYSLDFEDRDYVVVPPAAFSNIDSAITIAFWQYGDPVRQPQNDYAFEGYDAGNNRVVNSHLPWNNSQVYWDAGNDGGSYDRINKAANNADFEGQWNHWVFVKDVKTGVMQMWLNGNLWHSGTGKVRDMSGIARFHIGANGNGGGNYDGMIDEFSVWSTVLDSAGIAQIMYNDITAGHPNYSSLELYYQFNDGSGNTTLDAGPNGHHGTLQGMPAWINVEGPSLWRNISTANQRADVVFEQGVYTATTDSIARLDSTMNPGISIVFFSNLSDPTMPTDTIYVWNQWYNKYTYDANLNPTDSTLVTPDSILYKVETNYYSDPFEVVDRFEIGRYITPYGIGLDLGDGWTWIYDVTDYENLLHDSVHLSSGNWQELLDMKFLFIEGTPPREVLDIENMWPGGSKGYGALVSDATMQPVDITLNASASTFKVVTRASGHGFGSGENCAEFCDKIHYLDVNGTERDDWHVWMECSDNPLYPQGGTWVYNRAGWCPGAIVQTNHHEITPWVTAGDTETFDYRVQGFVPPGTGEGNYRVEAQLISYGDIEHQLDARIDEILAPNSHELYSRFNPICSNPKVVLRNTGSDTLRMAEITYGVEGGTPCTYTWWGELAFMEAEEVELPLFDWNGSGTNVFYATTDGALNGGTDQYLGNSKAKATFEAPPRYDNKFELWWRTNNAPHENQWTIKDDMGNVIHGASSFTANTVYRDTFELAPGCYTFEMIDWDAGLEGGDGLSWWANSDGTGYCRLKQISGPVLILFEPDFGYNIYHEFTVGYDVGAGPTVACATGVNEPQRPPIGSRIEVFPNPTDGMVNVSVANSNEQDVVVSIVSVLGIEVFSETLNNVGVEQLNIDLTGQTPGTYLVTVTSGSRTVSERVLLLPVK